MHLHPDQQRAEDQALDAAHADRTRGKTTIVIAQTSNEHLDELNARAQAIRRQHGQLGGESMPVPGRPYELQSGDHIQLRRTIRHEQGQLRNGTTAVIAHADPRSGTLDLRLADGTEPRLPERDIAEADVRLAYVQHPFPAQGHTTDTAHLIVAGTSTREGTYVALTRARHETHIYSADTPDRSAELDRLQDLADRISRTEPELASIQTPLRHEAAILDTLDTSEVERGLDTAEQELLPVPGAPRRPSEPEPVAEIMAGANAGAHAQSDSAGKDEEPRPRVWPTTSGSDLAAPHHALEAIERDQTLGWEPCQSGQGVSRPSRARVTAPRRCADRLSKRDANGK